MFFLITTSLFSQERIAINDFTRIRVSHAFTITLVPSDKNEIVAVSLPENLNLKDIVRVNENGTLRISIPESNSGWVRSSTSSRRGELIVYFTHLEGINISGASRVKSEESIWGEQFNLSVSGASSAQLSVIATQLNVNTSGASSVTLDATAAQITSNTSGSSNLRLSGAAQSHQLTASGSSRVRVGNFVTQEAFVSISGASSAEVTAQQVRGGISGSSRLNVNSNAETSVRTSGSSSIRRR
jgi:hypothetical protein